MKIHSISQNIDTLVNIHKLSFASSKLSVCLFSGHCFFQRNNNSVSGQLARKYFIHSVFSFRFSVCFTYVIQIQPLVVPSPSTSCTNLEKSVSQAFNALNAMSRSSLPPAPPWPPPAVEPPAGFGFGVSLPGLPPPFPLESEVSMEENSPP